MQIKELSPIRKTIVGVQFLFVAFGSTVLVPLLIGLNPATALFTAGPSPVLGGMMLLLFGSIASVGVQSLIQSKVDLNRTRNVIIFAVTMTPGIGGAVLTFGTFSLSGIGLSALVGVLFNLILPDKDMNNVEQSIAEHR